MLFTHKLKKSCNGVILLVGFLVFTGLPSCYGMSIKDEMQLTDKQQESFDKFKAKALEVQMPEYMKKEIVLIKYFRYAGLDENKAVELLIDNLKWRLEWGFEKLSEDDFNEHSRTYPYSVFTDKLGRGVIYLKGKDWDCSVATRTPESTKKVTNYFYHIVEESYVKGVTNITGKKESGAVHLEDLYGAEVSQFVTTACMGLVKEVTSNLDRRWPLGLQTVYIVNANPLISPTLNVIRNALPEKMQALVHPYDENDAIWMPELLKFIPEDKLPAELYIRSRHQPQAPMGGGGSSMAGGMGMFGQAAPGMVFGGGVPAPEPSPNPDGRSIKKGKKKKKKAKKNDVEDEDDDDGLD